MASLDKSNSVASSCVVPNEKGLHARAAAQIVTLSSEFACNITISHGNKSAQSLSLIKLLTLDAPKGSILTIEASGQHAKKAVDEIQQLIESGFGE